MRILEVFCSISLLLLLSGLHVVGNETYPCVWRGCTATGYLLTSGQVEDLKFKPTEECGQIVEQEPGVFETCKNQCVKLYYRCMFCHRFYRTNHPTLRLESDHRTSGCTGDHLNQEPLTLNLLDRACRQGPSRIRK
ncbi:hypothetical protein PGT21_010484 [Puccinia graminis f. sp. tritici]|uniref:Uncharacterized protein n=1 Tax=Puccinia graminis f. sp. tritici TaxID=56615 RepID=A0A5B0LPQ9_PUCGR|nr:hypothetical protein PGT21_010484 [Puccinia graminis f. sp. tritici]KAA1132342.1 hypothetical protein PGTUg99_004297 [Puccinia graminis f. sp. tritici]